MDRLRNVVFSFYREDLQIKCLLAPLLLCEITRSWGTIRIECVDLYHLEQVSELLDYLKPPFLLLKLGQKISLRAPGLSQRIYSLEETSPTDLVY